MNTHFKRSPVPERHHQHGSPSTPHQKQNTRTRRDATEDKNHSSERIPLANPELNDLDDDRETVTAPYPGIDDGFFENAHSNGDNKPHGDNSNDAEEIPLAPTHPAEPEDPEENEGKSNTDDHHNDDIPVIFSRAGGDGGSNTDEADNGSKRPMSPGRPGGRIPDFGIDLERAGQDSDTTSIPDVNVYQHKKTLAQGMMDLALFSANANQLRYVLESSTQHPYYYPSVVFISVSLMFQVAVGIGLIWNATYNVKDDKEICIANKINNFTVIGIFLITVINVFISAFGVAGPAPATIPTTAT